MPDANIHKRLVLIGGAEDKQDACMILTEFVRLAGGPQAQALLEHGTAYYAVVSLIWSAAIIVVFGLLAAMRFSRR